jgi:hypothetical protein
MIKIRDWKTGEIHLVYENEEEFPANTIKLSHYLECQAGEYTMSDNGYYLPVLAHKKYTSKDGKSLYCHVCLPLVKYRYKINVKNNKVSCYGRFLWKREVEQVSNLPKKLSVKELLFANLIVQGVPLYDAAGVAFQDVKQYPYNIMKRLFNHPPFIEFIAMKTAEQLQHALQENNINYNAVMSVIREALDQNEDNKHKQWAVNTAIGLLDKLSSAMNAPAHNNLLTSNKIQELPPANYEVVE